MRAAGREPKLRDVPVAAPALIRPSLTRGPPSPTSWEKGGAPRIDAVELRLESKIDAVEQRLEAKIDAAGARLETRVAEAQAATTRWMVGTFVALAGLFWAIVKYTQ